MELEPRNYRVESLLGSVRTVMEKVISEVNQIIQVLEEKEIPANPLKAEKLEKGISKMLDDYFKLLHKSLPMDEIEKIYHDEIQK